MPDRKPFPWLARGLMLLSAAVAASGAISCAAYASYGADVTMSGTLSAASGPRTFALSAANRATINEILSLGSANTYMSRLLEDRDSTIERWPDHIDRPLRVWIDSSSLTAGRQAAFPAAVRGAFARWSATGIPLRFSFVSSPKHADVRVRWVDQLAHKTGSTTWRTDRHGWLVSGDILLSTHTSDGRSLGARGMRAIALHEVGHALGLSHSADPTDIMASLIRVDSLSAPDRNTIRLLYTLPVGRVH